MVQEPCPKHEHVTSMFCRIPWLLPVLCMTSFRKFCKFGNDWGMFAPYTWTQYRNPILIRSEKFMGIHGPLVLRLKYDSLGEIHGPPVLRLKYDSLGEIYGPLVLRLKHDSLGETYYGPLVLRLKYDSLGEIYGPLVLRLKYDSLGEIDGPIIL